MLLSLLIPPPAIPPGEQVKDLPVPGCPTRLKVSQTPIFCEEMG